MKKIFRLVVATVATLHMTPASAQDAGVLSIAMPSDVQSWDPMATNSSPTMPILRAVFDAPLTQTPDLTLAPGIIDEWSWREDGLVLNVRIRDDVLFHNGDRLTTRDLRFAYLERFREDVPLPFAGIFGSTIEEIEIVSDTEAVFHLNKPMPTLPNWMAFLGQFIVPKDHFETVGREAFMEQPVGSGPYRLVSYDRGSRIVLEAFDDYWGGAPEIKTVIFEIVREPSARVAALQAGRVDIAVNLPIREATRLAGIGGITSVIEPTSEIMMIHARNTGTFTSHNVRVAAHMAIDKQLLSDAFFEARAVPIAVPGTPTTPGYPDTIPVGYDPEGARALLAEEGFGPDNPVSIGFVTTNGAFPNDFEIARAIVGMWAEVGINAEIEVVELPRYYEMSSGGLLPETTLFTWSNSTDDPELYLGSLLDPDGRFSVWKSDDMREMIHPLLSEIDDRQRFAGYEALGIYAMQNGYNIPLLQAVGTAAHRDTVDFTWFANTWFEVGRITKE